MDDGVTISLRIEGGAGTERMRRVLGALCGDAGAAAAPPPPEAAPAEKPKAAKARARKGAAPEPEPEGAKGPGGARLPGGGPVDAGPVGTAGAGPVGLERLREVAYGLVQAGRREELAALLGEFGAAALPEVAEADHTALLARLEALR
ncbi:MAG: hypothetical protein LBL86_12085 [Coriobacteriales bacterium]|jgi:hypothetical protein|nr:hypothetical protein [Coriobacteriales bacterium]